MIYLKVKALKYFEQPFPVSWSDNCMSIFELIDKTGLTLDEIEYGIETGNLVKGFYIIQPADKWISELRHEYMVSQVNRKRYSGKRADVVKEICKQLNITNECYRQIFHRAMKKLKKNGKDKDLLRLLLELYARQGVTGVFDFGEYEIEIKEDINITEE
jgi:hypothetical protein